MSNLPDAMADLEVLRAAVCVAAQDGRISAAERKVIEDLADRAGVGRASLAAMIEAAERDPEFNREQFKIVQTDPLPTLKALATVALADGRTSSDQHEVLASFAGRLGIEKSRLDFLLKAVGDG